MSCCRYLCVSHVKHFPIPSMSCVWNFNFNCSPNAPDKISSHDIYTCIHSVFSMYVHTSKGYLFSSGMPFNICIFTAVGRRGGSFYMPDILMAEMKSLWPPAHRFSSNKNAFNKNWRTIAGHKVASFCDVKLVLMTATLLTFLRQSKEGAARARTQSVHH